MNLYFAGNIGSKKTNQYLLNKYGKRLFSFYLYVAKNDWGYGEIDRIKEWISKMTRLKRTRKKRNIVTLPEPLMFLDSGAFSAWSKQVEIDIYEYIEFIKYNEKVLTAYAVLDDISDPELTLENQKIMEKEGLKPIPCYHYGEDISYLEYYVERYNYIALGGMVPISTKLLRPWLDKIFHDYICDKSGRPIIKVHGFGMTSHRLMVRYPWYSLDSTSWVLTGRFGAIYVPKVVNGKYNYIKEPWKINFSSESSSKKVLGKHFFTFTKQQQDVIREYVQSKGFVIGDSVYTKVDKKYKLQKNEKWYDKDNYEIQTTVSPGLSNDYRKRDEINIEYFLDMEAAMPKWPWNMKPRKVRGFVGRKKK